MDGDILMCGARRDRTDDLLKAIQALSQLSYGPIYRHKTIANISNAILRR